MPAAADVAGDLDRAHDTLSRGIAFLARGLRMPGHRYRPGIEGRYRARVIGNALRELDRFLFHLVGAAAAARPEASRPIGGNTVRSLARLRGDLGLATQDGPRLHALERSRACLFYCQGLVSRPDARGGGRMTLGWSRSGAAHEGLATAALGSRIDITPAQIAGVCAFYGALGADLLAIGRAGETHDGRRSRLGSPAVEHIDVS